MIHVFDIHCGTGRLSLQMMQITSWSQTIYGILKFSYHLFFWCVQRVYYDNSETFWCNVLHTESKLTEEEYSSLKCEPITVKKDNIHWWPQWCEKKVSSIASKQHKTTNIHLSHLLVAPATIASETWHCSKYMGLLWLCLFSFSQFIWRKKLIVC